MQDVAAMVVVIAVIDPKSKVLLTDAQLARFNGADGQPPALIDWGNTTCAGCPTQTQWQTTPGLAACTMAVPHLTRITIRLPRPGDFRYSSL